jgi:hypothetical protein
VFSIPVFTNAAFCKSDQTVLRLAERSSAKPWSQRDARRACERLQTVAFLNDVMKATGSPSPYALEELLMKGLPGVVFPADRPKLCDRMASLGQPAVSKQLAPSGKKDLRTERWFDRMVALAPSSGQLLTLPIWRLLDPRPIDHVEWHDLAHMLGTIHLEQLGEPLTAIPPTAAWMITMRASAMEDECEYFVNYLGHQPDRAVMTTMLLQLRRWEALGNLIGYDLSLQQALRAASHPTAALDLAVLQPRIEEYIVQCFGAVRVPHPELNLDTQTERVAAGRSAWERRVLVGRGVGQPGFDAAV